MPATQEISESLIRENITRAMADVFKTMLSRHIELQPEADAKAIAAAARAGTQPRIIGTVGFLGDINGLIYLYLDQAFADLCTCSLLGIDGGPSAVESDAVNDAIGELTNMIVGGFKNGLGDAGYSCRLTIPSIMRGTNFSIEPINSAQRYVYQFESQGSRVVADILMRNEE